MRSTVISISLALAALGLAAPTEKRAPVGTINLYTDNNYGGQKHTINIDFSPFDGEGGCVAETLPSNIDNQVSSLDFTGDTRTFNCRLVDRPGCVFGDSSNDQTWAINTPVPNLKEYGGTDAPGFDNLASSVWCTPVINPER